MRGMKTKLFVLGCAVILAGATVRAQMLELGARYWEMKPSGTASIGASGIEGTEIDIEDDLGYGKEEKIIGFDATLGSGIDLALSYLSLDLAARNRIDRTIRFGDTVYRARADVSSALEAELWRAALRYQLGSHGFRGGLLAGIQYVDLTAQLSAPGFADASEKTSTVLPVIGAVLRFDPAPLFRIDLGIAGGAWDFDKTSVAFWDAEANFRVNINPFFVGIGYRHISIDGDDSSIPLEADLTFKGMQFIGGLVF